MYGHTGQGASASFSSANVNGNSMNRVGAGNGVDVSIYHLRNVINDVTKSPSGSGLERINTLVFLESNSDVDCNSSLSSLECDEDYGAPDDSEELGIRRVALPAIRQAVRAQSLGLDFDFEMNTKDEIGMLLQEALLDIISD